MTALLLGCGNDRTKKLCLGTGEWSEPLITMDMNPNCGADIVHDLDNLPLPFPDDHFNELAAYDVLEHIGRQGDWRGFFDEFAEYWRILKPDGTFGIIVPIGDDFYADPGHTRFFSAAYFRFLDQDWYDQALSQGLQVTDYRWYWKRSFKMIYGENINNHHLAIVLRKA